MPKTTTSSYVRIIVTDLNNTRHLLGLQHSIAGLLPDSKVLIDLAEIDDDPEDFFMGIDTAPLYSGFLQFLFTKKDGAEIRNFFKDSPEFAKVKIQKDNDFIETFV